MPKRAFPARGAVARAGWLRVLDRAREQCGSGNELRENRRYFRKSGELSAELRSLVIECSTQNEPSVLRRTRAGRRGRQQLRRQPAASGTGGACSCRTEAVAEQAGAASNRELVVDLAAQRFGAETGERLKSAPASISESEARPAGPLRNSSRKAPLKRAGFRRRRPRRRRLLAEQVGLRPRPDPARRPDLTQARFPSKRARDRAAPLTASRLRRRPRQAAPPTGSPGSDGASSRVPAAVGARAPPRPHAAASM